MSVEWNLYLSFLEQNDCTPPKYGELSEYTDSAHTEMEDLSSRYMNGSNVYDAWLWNKIFRNSALLLTLVPLLLNNQTVERINKS